MASYNYDYDNNHVERPRMREAAYTYNTVRAEHRRGPSQYRELNRDISRERERDRQREQERVIRIERSRQLIQEVDTYDRDLRYILEPILKDDRVCGQVAEHLQHIRRDTRLRERTATELLRAMGAIAEEERDARSDENESGPTAPLRASPPHDKSPKGFLSPFINAGHKQGGGGYHSGSGSDADETDISDLSRASSHRSARRSSGRRTPSPTGPAPPSDPNFMEWAQFDKHVLPRRGNFVQKHHEAILATYKDMNVNFEAYGFGLGLDNFAMKIRDWCHRRDLLALWRSSDDERRILVPVGASPAETSNGAIAEDLERRLFDVDKFYDGSAQYLTALTYGDGHFGTITLFRVEVHQSLPRRVQPIAAMEQVPRAIIKKMAGQVKGPEKTTLKLRKGALRWGPRGVRVPGVKRLRGTSGRDHGVRDKLRRALAQIPEADEADGVAATVPQMLAWLHVRTGVLQELQSGPARVGRRQRVQVSWRNGPQERRHDSISKVTIVVLSPKECKWTRERIVWR